MVYVTRKEIFDIIASRISIEMTENSVSDYILVLILILTR